MIEPTPAAVRFALKDEAHTNAERDAFVAGPHEDGESILRDHIRAITEEMRAHAERAERVAAVKSKAGADVLHNYANDLRVFADKLEGIES